jgi:molybdate transport system substrate-binding protein
MIADPPLCVQAFRRRTSAFLAVALLAFALPARGPADTSGPLVAAASDLQFALEDIATSFHRDTGLNVHLSMGSSGNFARQIRQGAPFEVYLSADEDYVYDLAADGFTRDEGVLYAIGRIVVLVPKGSTVQADSWLDDLAASLDDGRLRRFAIANPEHAPYGLRAEQALRHRGLWDTIRSRLVFGENVSQAAQFALSGATQGGIVAYSLVLSPMTADRGVYELIPESWHEPLRQRMVLLSGAGDTAVEFYAYMQQPEARQVLERYGFAVPEPL